MPCVINDVKSQKKNKQTKIKLVTFLIYSPTCADRLKSHCRKTTNGNNLVLFHQNYLSNNEGLRPKFQETKSPTTSAKN